MTDTETRRAPLSVAMLELLREPNFAHLTTFDAQGEPRGNVIWVDTDGENVLLNSAAGRAWPTRAERNRTVSLTVADRENPYRYLAVTGVVDEVTQEGAEDQIDRLAKLYFGHDRYQFRAPGERRVTLVVRPTRATLAGGAS